MILIILGGLGFVVLSDLARKAGTGKRLTFHSKLVLSITAALIVGGSAVFFLFERTGLLSGFTPGEKITASFFQSITTRTEPETVFQVHHFTLHVYRRCSRIDSRGRKGNYSIPDSLLRVPRGGQQW